MNSNIAIGVLFYFKYSKLNLNTFIKYLYQWILFALIILLVKVKHENAYFASIHVLQPFQAMQLSADVEFSNHPQESES